MGTLASMQKLYDNILKSNAEMSPAEARAETERYASNVTTGIRTTDGLYTLFDNAFAGSPNVRRFSGAERAQRKAISAKVRQAMTSYISTYADEKSTMPEAEPWLQNFLVPAGHTANAGIYQQQNEKRLLEFQPDTDAFREHMENNYLPDVQRAYPDKNPDQVKEKATQELQKMRGDFTETLVVTSANVMKNLDTMLDPSLPSDKLSENIAKIMRAKRINDCMEIYLEKANNGFMTVRDEIKEMMEQQIKLRPRLTMAVNKLEAMANPMYEYFDVDRLGAYDVSAIRKVWEKKLLPNEAQSWREKKSRKHTHFNQYVTADVQDNFTSFLENAASYSKARQELSRQQLQEAVEKYEFAPKEARRFRETPSTVDSPEKEKQMRKTGATHTLEGRRKLHLYQDTPVAYYQKERTVIFTPSDDLNGLTTSRPEELYNYSFVGTTANLAKELEDADRWYKTNKHGYGTMRKQLAKITKMGKLPKNFNQSDIRKRREAYQALLESSTNYLQIKGVANLNEDALARDAQERDAVELARIDAVRRAKTFADMKIRELDMITNARLTEIKRGFMENGNDNQINADPAENPIGGDLINGNQENPIRNDFINEVNHELRENSPVLSLHQHYDKNFAAENKLPESLAKMLEGSLSELEWCWNNDKLLEKDLENQYDDACDSYYRSLGAIAAAEMVLAERKRMGGANGPVERFFTDAKQNVYTQLGFHVENSFKGDETKSLDKVKKVLREFNTGDPRFNLKEYGDMCQLLHAPVFQQDIAVRYRSDVNPTGNPQRDEAFQKFVGTRILDGLEKIQQDFLIALPTGGKRDYLAACVVRDIVLLERGNDPTKEPGALEQKMMNSPEELIEDVKKFRTFKDRMDRAVRQHQGMYRVFSRSIMNDLAVKFVEDYNEKLKNAQNGKNNENDKPKMEKGKQNEQDAEAKKNEMLKQFWG